MSPLGPQGLDCTLWIQLLAMIPSSALFHLISVCPSGPPYATIIPEHTSVQPGKLVQLQCLAHGTPPLTFQWSRVDGILPERAVARNELLRLEPTGPADSGRYRCQVSNKVGSAEAFAQVLVQGKQLECQWEARGQLPCRPFLDLFMSTWDAKASSCYPSSVSCSET